MAVQTIVTTVVPQGFGTHATNLRFSLHFSPRLVAPSVVFNNFGDFTGNWPEFANWPDTVMAALAVRPIVIRQYDVNGEVGSPFALGVAQLKSAAPDGELWKSLFFPTMPISNFDPNAVSTRFGSATFRSYPLMALHADQISRWSDLLHHHPNGNVTPNTASQSLGPIANAATSETRGVYDSAITAFYDRYKSQPFGKVMPSGSLRAGAGNAAAPTDARGFDYAQLVHFLAPRTPPSVIKVRPVTPPAIDFHQAITLFSDHPALLRRLGLVLDFEVTGVVAGTSLAVDSTSFTIANSDVVTPRTAVTPTKNLAAPTVGSNLTADRVANLTRRFNPADDAHQDGWDLITLDVEGAAVKTLGMAATVHNAKAAKGPAAPTSIESPVLRQTGIRLVRSNRAVDLANILKRHDGLLATVNQNNTVLYLDDLVRGYRIDIWDSVTARWHALTRRDMSYVHDLYGTVLAPDSVSNGWFSNEGVVSTATSASADPTSNSDDIFVGETVAEWSGWSLVAPRPGKTLAADGSAAPVAQPSSRHPDLKLTVRAAVTPGTLPSLRFGRVYAARLRSADIVGGGPRLTDFSALATSGNASQAIRYARYEPLPPPEIVAGAPFVGGDSLTQLVLLHRNGVHPNPVTVPTVRYLLPPATTAGLAELHGGFDGVAAATSFTVMSQREGQRIGPASSPSWMPVPYTIARDLQSDPSSPSYYASKGPVVQPPYLVDKMVAGLRLVGRGVPETLLDFNPFGTEPWWNRRGWALTLRPVGVGTSVVVSTAASSATRPRTVNFDIPIGQMFDVALSSTPDGFRLNQLAGYNQVANGSALNKATLLTDIARGRNIRVSPPTRLKLVHAVQIPLIEPVVNAPVTVTRSPHGTTADFTGAWFADRYSTGRLDIELHWSEPNDTQPNGPVQTNGAGHLPPIQIPYPEPGTLNSPQGFGALSFQFGDTRHRAVKVSATATSRYASYFSRTKIVTLSTVGTPLLVAGETGIQPMTERVSGVVANPSPINGWTDLDTLERDVHYTINWTTGRIAAVAGSTAVGRQVKVAFTPLPISRSTTAANTRTVHVKASAPPVTPRIAEIVPVFSDGRWGPYPNAMTATGVQRNRNGRVLRVYLERPWFSSGDNEMLGVVLMRSATTTAGAYTGVVAPTTANAGPLSVEQRVTSAWGRDPLVDGVAVAQRLTVASFPLATDAPGHGRWAVDRQAAGLLVHTVVVPHAVQFDSARKQWFSDIALDLGAAYRPFVRLALCRFQPYAMPGMFMSDIELVDTAQLSPERTLIVAGSGNTRTITLHGPAYLQRAVGLVAGEAAQSPPAVRPGPLVTVQLQRRSGGVNVPSTDPDVGWVDVRAAAVMALSPTARIGNRQEFVAKNFNVGVNASDQCRIVVREYESETKDQFSPTPRTRMVWADSYRLR